MEQKNRNKTLRKPSSSTKKLTDVFTIEDINSSSFVLYNNVNVMKKSFSDHPFIGRGIGSYELAYQKYSLTKEDDFLIKKGFDFNSKDGNSLYIRSIVEMGSIGLLFWPVFIRRFFIRKNSFQDESTTYDVTWIYSGAVLTLILGYLLRQGNYFLNGFPFFVLLYYFINKEFINDNPILITDSSTDE